MSAQTLDHSVLEGKDREQLVAIAQALGVKSVTRAKKADLIAKIIEQAGGGSSESAAAPAAPAAPVEASSTANGARPASGRANAGRSKASRSSDGNGLAASPETSGEPQAQLSLGEATAVEAPSDAPVAEAVADASENPAPTPKPARGRRFPQAAAVVADGVASAVTAAPDVVLGADGEPLAEWEIALMQSGDSSDTTADGASDSDGEGGGADGDGDGDGRSRRRRRRRGRNRDDAPGGDGAPADGGSAEGAAADQPRPPQQQAPRNEQAPRPERQERPERNFNDRNDRGGRNDRNDRNRNRNDRDRDRFNQGRDRGDTFEETDGPVSNEPIQVSGYLDLRDEGYGFLRVKGYLPSREDGYISVKQTRQYGLRKGDHVVGTMRPASPKEKNPAVLDIFTVNGGDPERAKARPRFEDLTPLFPDEKLHLSNPLDPTDMTARIIDLISPIGKGQRGLIVSPPKAGKTTIIKTIAKAIEHNNPEVKLMVLQIDERPEEVTDMKRTVKGEVIASTFDRPSEEHTHVAELVIERAKRMVEAGQDVVVILDGITRLSRAYNLAAPASGKILSGGIDAGALYPPKKFFGAARNIEEGGSLTILATCLVDTNSRMDEAIFEEFKGTGNMELRLDRKLSERRIFPAIDVDASSTRHEELLFDRKQLQLVWKLRRVLSGLAADGNAGPGLELLIDRLKSFRTNDEFLSEIAKQPSM